MKMNRKTGNSIRMMAYEGKSINQIAKKTFLGAAEIEDYLITQGIKPVYTVKQGKQENKGSVKAMEEQKILGKQQETRQYGGKAAGKIPLTDEQKAEILHKLESGVSVKKIAEQYDRDASWVYRFYRKERAKQAEQAEKQAEKQTETPETPETPEFKADFNEFLTAPEDWTYNPKNPKMFDDPIAALIWMRDTVKAVFGESLKVTSASVRGGYCTINFDVTDSEENITKYAMQFNKASVY